MQGEMKTTKRLSHTNEEGIEGLSVKRAKVGTIINEDIESKDKGDEVAAPSTNEDDRKKKPVNIWPIKPKPEHVVKIGKSEYLHTHSQFMWPTFRA